ncbi:MAG: SIR2 family protein [Syntrophobacteraceae bacterium]
MGPVMDARDAWEHPETLKNYLAQQLLKGRIALILGSGISTDFNLPDWPKLITDLYASKGQSPPSGMNMEKQAEVFQDRHYSGNLPGFLEAVRSALYSNFTADFEELRKNPTLGAIGALVMASGRGSASTVVNFNFDDILEMYLEYHGFVANSVAGEKYWSTNSDVTVFHPHGLLPKRPKSEMSKDIIFGQMAYSKIVGDTSSPWRQLLLTVMRTHTCILLGLSGDDANLDSFLVACKDNHVCTRTRTLFWGLVLKDKEDLDRRRLWERRGIYMKVVSSYSQGQPSFLFEICQRAAEIRMNA